VDPDHPDRGRRRRGAVPDRRVPAGRRFPESAHARRRPGGKRNDYATAERLFREATERYPQTDAAPEAIYWAGVSKYRAANDPGALKQTAAALSERYPASIWTKKAAVWRD
jgi:hypothetical protein